jgi:hypothetical protein
MVEPVRGFFAFPAAPETVGGIVDGAIERLRRRSFLGEIEPWSELDIAGRFIVEGILGRIDSSNLVIADISHLNFNVTYEVGYAIGAQKRLLVVKHSGLTEVNNRIGSLGIFDTLGYKEYNNAEDLEQLIRATIDLSPLHPDWAQRKCPRVPQFREAQE